MRGKLHFDAVVIGAGTAGLVAGARLAEGGARVCVLAKGVGSTHLAPGTIDVLGYSPERVERPGRAVTQLAADDPEHPYALLGTEVVEDALHWFSARIAAGLLPGYRYVGDLERNHLLPTAVGVLRPSALVPETMAAGDGTSSEPLVVVGTSALRDFHASLCAANLGQIGLEARAVVLELTLDRADQNSLGLARRFDDPSWRGQFADQLAPLLGSDGRGRVGLPAVLGIADPHTVWTELQDRLGRPVFEIPTLPPSVPGMRMFEILRATLRSARGRLVIGAEVVGSERQQARVNAVISRAAGRDVVYSADWFVLAGGGFASGAIELDSRWRTRERIFGLPLRGLPEPGQPRFVGEYFAEQPIARVGVAVDGELRAEGLENVLVAGAALPGAIPWRELSGEGIALASGYRAAGAILAAAGVRERITA
ncbi:MAG: glycerol-3-phosphate dehydrogenase subunit GlpB [Solirubrobacterales bacterium]|nr:glycerol-3-phosphate dehydrogenase subunit GlpB [Solirubrobacterales bacterium]